MSSEITENTKSKYQQTANNTNLTDQSLTLLNESPIPTELHVSICDKFYRCNKKIMDTENIWKIKSEVSALKSYMKRELLIYHSKIDVLSTELSENLKKSGKPPKQTVCNNSRKHDIF